MRTTTAVLCLLTLTSACAAGNDDRDGADSTSAASVGDSGDGSTTGATTMPTSTTATATSLTGGATMTTDAGTSDAGATSDGGDTTTGASDLTCDAYCGVYLDGCADHSEYANMQDCLDNCAQWPVGDASDTAVDSLGCRLYHATVAASTDPDVHCPHAGPSGAGMCVTAEAPTCDVYCNRYFGNCHDELNAFADMDECLATCATWYPGTDADVDGHTIGCHSYHANAAVGDPATHCPHAGPGGGGVCVL